MLTGVYRFPPMESVIYGRPFAEALKERVEASGALSVFVLASGTLNRETDMVGQVRTALGNRLAGVHARIGKELYRTRHRYGESLSEFRLIFFQADVDHAAALQNLVFEKFEWADISSLPRYEFLEADKELVGLLASRSIQLDW